MTAEPDVVLHHKTWRREQGAESLAVKKPKPGKRVRKLPSCSRLPFLSAISSSVAGTPKTHVPLLWMNYVQPMRVPWPIGRHKPANSAKVEIWLEDLDSNQD